jgi:hypothetical protein
MLDSPVFPSTSISPAMFTWREITFAASAMSERMLLKTPLAAGRRRSSSMMCRSIVTMWVSFISSPRVDMGPIPAPLYRLDAF